MEFAFDLWSHDDVRQHADAILEQLEDGSMPCDGAWPSERVEMFQAVGRGGHARVALDLTSSPPRRARGARHTDFGTFPLRVKTSRISLCPRSAVGPNMQGHPPSITAMPCFRP